MEPRLMQALNGVRLVVVDGGGSTGRSGGEGSHLRPIDGGRGITGGTDYIGSMSHFA